MLSVQYILLKCTLCPSQKGQFQQEEQVAPCTSPSPAEGTEAALNPARCGTQWCPCQHLHSSSTQWAAWDELKQISSPLPSPLLGPFSWSWPLPVPPPLQCLIFPGFPGSIWQSLAPSLSCSCSLLGSAESALSEVSDRTWEQRREPGRGRAGGGVGGSVSDQKMLQFSEGQKSLSFPFQAHGPGPSLLQPQTML